MKLRLQSHPQTEKAFTLVEVALCLAIIGFAIVAIMGVIPYGMTSQRDARWDTIINEDSQFWLNAIRTGARETRLPDLTRHVLEIRTNATAAPMTNFADSAEIIGLLSRPFVNNRARVRVLSTSAAELSSDTEIGMEYFLFTSVLPVTNSYALLTTNLYDLRLVFRWPAYPNGSFDVNNKRVLRALVRGQLVETNGPGLFFFDNSALNFMPTNTP